MAFSWPGNVRQLENVLLNAWGPERPPRASKSRTSRSRPVASPAPEAVPESHQSTTSLDAHKAGERERILGALQSCNWNRVKAAQIVGLPRRTFYRRLKEYGIQ